jgi:O-6-methylguanine DNA methyltransferase
MVELPIGEPHGPGDSPSFLYYTATRSPFGELWLAGTQRGIRRLWLPPSDESCLKALAHGLGTRLRHDPSRFVVACQQLGQYFAGQRRSFDLQLDLGGSAFQRKVWAATRRIPYGQVCTYGELAQAIDAPGSARAVGGALGSNPVPIIVPCHRVLRGDGTLGGFAAGVEIKRALLRLEGFLQSGEEGEDVFGRRGASPRHLWPSASDQDLRRCAPTRSNKQH